MELTDVKALVTGGSKGIGKATAKWLIDHGAEMVICARSEDELSQTAEEIGAHAVQADVAVEEDVISLIEQTVSLMPDYNVLVNNAGFGRFGLLHELDRETMESVLNTNVIGAMMVARESAKHFIEQSYGNIVNISSTAGKRGFEGGTAYCASKFALGAMTECWRSELRKHNVRVMQVNPSEVQTEFSQNAGLGSREFNETKLIADDIAQTIASMLQLPDRGFLTETSVWATNPQ